MSNFGNAAKKTKYGIVTIRNPGRKEAPPNLATYAQTKTRHVQLQGPALRAFKAAEQRIATKKQKFILITGVGYRSYGLQASLYYGPDNVGGRYADPDGSMHVEALAVDVQWDVSTKRKADVTRALKAEGFIFGVDGEPWHASFGFSG